MSELHFAKGHGTENDFIIIPDANGVIDLSDSRVRALCDRRAGLGADGVIRVVRTDACDDPAAVAARDEAQGGKRIGETLSFVIPASSNSL